MIQGLCLGFSGLWIRGCSLSLQSAPCNCCKSLLVACDKTIAKVAPILLISSAGSANRLFCWQWHLSAFLETAHKKLLTVVTADFHSELWCLFTSELQTKIQAVKIPMKWNHTHQIPYQCSGELKLQSLTQLEYWCPYYNLSFMFLSLHT